MFEMPNPIEQSKNILIGRIEKIDEKGLENLIQRLGVADRKEAIQHVAETAKTQADVAFFENILELAEKDFPFELPDTDSDIEEESEV